jgi:UDP-N-acetylmuramyl pentapeptide phosphotransferase/UDP-N-acetylglucosamine-1-phosphate transferase
MLVGLVLLGTAWVGWLLLSALLSRVACRLFGLEKPNFRGDRIPASVGITFLLVCAGTYGALVLGRPWLGANLPSYLFRAPRFLDTAPLFLLVSVGFGLLGLLDDLWGSREVGGFRGHLGSLARGRPTTGVVKLFGGIVLALFAAWRLHGPLPFEAVAEDWLPRLLDAALIALAANTLNLLDVRPGRALFGFVLLALPTIVVLARDGSDRGGVLLGAAAAGAALEWLPDTRARAMMGDAGSNLLGAAAGLAAAIELSVGGRVALVAVLLGLNLLAERVSLSAIIERVPWLRAVDRAMGVR